jgi:hypothetical protein
MAFAYSVSGRDENRPLFWRVLAVLLAIDALLLIAPVAAAGLVQLGLLESVPHLLKIQPIWGLPSLFIYLKWLLLAAFLGLAWRASGTPLLLSLALIFLLLLVDDSLELHEQLGTAVKDRLGFGGGFGLRPDDLGELTIWAGYGGLCFGLFAIGYRRSTPAERRLGHVFLFGIAALAGFGIVVDMLGVAVYDLGRGNLNRAIRFFFDRLEDGGELVVASLLLAFAYATWAFGGDTALRQLQGWRSGTGSLTPS